MLLPVLAMYISLDIMVIHCFCYCFLCTNAIKYRIVLIFSIKVTWSINKINTVVK